jgi:hypothetical protein
MSCHPLPEKVSNVSELYVKEFNLTAPADTHKAFIMPGTFHVGAHEWFVFLKPLPPGDNPEGE